MDKAHLVMEKPLVTIGIPTFNEAKFLTESVESVLKQTYPNIEIVISDNGSTDETPKICEELEKKYENVRFIRHETNIGQNANFNSLPKEAKGKYFSWFAGHDVLDPTFVEKCVESLENLPTATLACPRTIETTIDGKHVREVKRRFDIRSMNASRRFREVMWRVDCNYVYGMFNREAMLQTNMFQLIPAADRVFLSEIAIIGPFVPADTVRYCRENRGGPQSEIEKRHRLMKYIFPEKTHTDKELESNEFYRPSFNAFHRAVKNGGFSFLSRLRLHFSVWQCGVMKSHLMPGADTLSYLTKKLLPRPVLLWIVSKMK